MMPNKKNLHPLKGPYCCPEWEKARQNGTDSEGFGELICEDEIACDGKPHVGNIGSNTELQPLRYCPWCGYCWAGK